jgi:patatin-like phospholipase/acyl hydrolase
VVEFSHHGPFRILSLGGGGFLGLFTAHVLARMEERYGSPLASKFELIAGTSVGGLLAIALASHIPAAEIARVFELRGREVFRASVVDRLLGLQGSYGSLFTSKYAADRLRSLIGELVGNDTMVSSLKANVLIPSFNLSEAKPHEFKNYGDMTSSDLLLVDIALATTAAPTYFPIHTVGSQLFADGGIHANTPDILAISEAMAAHKAQLEETCMISIGTTYSRRPVTALRSRNVGVTTWLGKLQIVDRLLEAQNQGSVFLSDRFLGERYVRINKYLEPSHANRLSLARADDFAVAHLKAAAGDAWRTLQRNEPKLSRVDAILGGIRSVGRPV